MTDPSTRPTDDDTAPVSVPGSAATDDATDDATDETTGEGDDDATAGDGAEPPVLLLRTPRPGELSPGWRLAVAATWIAVIVALAAVWSASVQLGLSTWWLGPRAEPRPRLVQLSPFVTPMLMLLGTIVPWRRLGWSGLGAAATVAAVGVGDLGRVPGLALVELGIAAAAAAVSIASFTGTYRRDPEATARPASPATADARPG